MMEEEEGVHHPHPLHPRIMNKTDVLGEDKGQGECIYCKVQQGCPEELEGMEEMEQMHQYNQFHNHD